jgi:hypothetical protein
MKRKGLEHINKPRQAYEGRSYFAKNWRKYIGREVCKA